MTKAVYLAAIPAAAILILCMGWITYLNRGSGTIITMFFTMLGAVSAFLITPAFVLRSSEIRERFPVSIVVDRNTNLPVSYFTISQPMAEMIQRAIYEEVSGKPGMLIPRKSQVLPNERFSRYAELIQYQVVQLCYVALRTSNRISSIRSPSGSDVRNETFEFFRPKKFEEIPGSLVVQAFQRNPFFGSAEQRWWLENKVSLPVPVETKLIIPDDKSVVFQKAGYFTIAISVESQGGMTGCPADLQRLIANKNVETLAYNIECLATFDKLTSENPETEENKKWVQVLFSRIKGELGG